MPSQPTIPVFASPLDRETFGSYSVEPYLRAEPEKPLYRFRDRIGDPAYPAAAGRYHLYLVLHCPWAQRLQIIVDLLGLGGAVTYSYLDDERDGRGWAFRPRRGPDPVNGFALLRDACLATDPAFDGHVSVPTLWDRETRRVVNNEPDEITTDLLTRFGGLADPTIDLYPQPLRAEADSLDSWLNDNLNLGVYRVAYAADQSEYDRAISRVFAALDSLETRLADRRYLFGDRLTASDIRLWVSLARFDGVYNPLFRANLRRLIDYPNLWGYARDLYAAPAFRRHTDFAEFKASYHSSFNALTYRGIIPASPIADWTAPHSRHLLTGKA